jgi:hypothetical protein
MTFFRLSPGAAPFLAGVFLICMCGLMLQIVETRAISVIAYYHMAFFAISVATLGMTAGSLFIVTFVSEFGHHRRSAIFLQPAQDI